MAIISVKKLAKHSQVMGRGKTVDYSKAELYASIQAVLDLLQSSQSRTAVNSAIEGTASGVFSVEQKAAIFVRAVDELKIQEDI